MTCVKVTSIGGFNPMAPHIQALKLFHDNDQLHVAIFAEPTESSDGWLRNFPWHEVFVYPPDSLASEELIPLEHIRYSFTFQPAFVAEWLADCIRINTAIVCPARVRFTPRASGVKALQAHIACAILQ